MADAGDSKSPALYGHVGSTPTSGTTGKLSAISGQLPRWLAGRSANREFSCLAGRLPALLRETNEVRGDLLVTASTPADVAGGRLGRFVQCPVQSVDRRREFTDPVPGKVGHGRLDAADLFPDLLFGLHAVPLSAIVSRGDGAGRDVFPPAARRHGEDARTFSPAPGSGARTRRVPAPAWASWPKPHPIPAEVWREPVPLARWGRVPAARRGRTV